MPGHDGCPATTSPHTRPEAGVLSEKGKEVSSSLLTFCRAAVPDQPCEVPSSPEPDQRDDLPPPSAALIGASGFRTKTGTKFPHPKARRTREQPASFFFSPAVRTASPPGDTAPGLQHRCSRPAVSGRPAREAPYLPPGADRRREPGDTAPGLHRCSRPAVSGRGARESAIFPARSADRREEPGKPGSVCNFSPL
jgi:hypothetical protein